jgi:glutathione S-transferase
MRLFGTTTSPFTRRVRVLALELGLPLELVSTATPEGDAALRQRSPLWKVPTLVLGEGAGERELWDSHAICAFLLERHGPGPFSAPAGHDTWREGNLVNAIDGALDAAINVFYLERDGVPRERAPYLQKQHARTASALAWVEGQLQAGDASFSAPAHFGLAELALVTALDWFRFRDRYPVDRHPRFTRFLQAHADRPSLRDTTPRT